MRLFRRASGENAARGRTLWRPSVEEEVREDLEFHLDMLARDYEAEGLPPVDARRRARAQFGDYDAVFQTCRQIAAGREGDRRTAEWFRGVGQDAVTAWRQWRRQPGLALLALAMLALGIGSTSAAFSVVDSVLLRPLPYPASNRLVALCEYTRESPGSCTVSPPDAMDWRRSSQSLATMGLARSWPFILTSDGRARGIHGGLATPDFFTALDVRPALGRLLAPEDQNGVGAAVTVLSYPLWRDAFGADSTIVGRAIILDNEPITVVGVLPEDFVQPRRRSVDLWRPLHIDPSDEENRDWRGFFAYARLAPGRTIAQAQDELGEIGRELARRHPESNEGWSVRVVDLRDHLVRGVQPVLWLFLGAVGCVLLIACANVANLLLARTQSRQGEIAVRAALGAGRTRLLRLLLLESLLLALVGGIGGLLVARGMLAGLHQFAPPGIPRLEEVGLDIRSLAFATGLILLTTVLFGAMPALSAARVDLNTVLRGVGRGRGPSERGRGGARNLLVAAETALALALLVAGGLLARSFMNRLAWEPGFDQTHLLTAWTFLSPGEYPDVDNVVRVYREATERLAALPGVMSASTASAGPAFGGGDGSAEVWVEGRPLPAGQRPNLRWFDVGEDYFQTLGIRLLAGRRFDARDRRGAPVVAIINETAARLLAPDGNPIGERATMPLLQNTFEIVGVVADVPPLDPTAAVEPEIYWPFEQLPRWASYFVLRTTGDPGGVARAAVDRLREVAPTMDISQIYTLPELVSRELVYPRFALVVMAVFSLTALVLAIGGVYGVVAYAVSQRTHEIGIRMALGADGRRVVALVVRQGLLPVALGLVVGLGAAMTFGGVLRSYLAGVEPTDIPTIGGVVVGMVTVAVVAAFLPARRAARVEPTLALRAE